MWYFHIPYTEKNVITKTRLYSFDPLKPLFYTVNLGFTGVNINFNISAQRQRQVPTIYVLSRNVKTTRFFHLKVFIFGGILNIFE